MCLRVFGKIKKNNKSGEEMLWEAKDRTCKNIQIAKEKILEIFDGWYIDSVVCPDRKNGEEINSLILTIRRDMNEWRICETCIHRNEWSHHYCDECCRNWEDNWEEG